MIFFNPSKISPQNLQMEFQTGHDSKYSPTAQDTYQFVIRAVEYLKPIAEFGCFNFQL